MTKEKILFDLETLKHNINVLLNENLDNMENEKQEKQTVYYQTFPEELDFMFSMIHFHKTDYEHYLFIDKFINASLKEGISKKYAEIEKWQHLKNNAMESLSALDNKSITSKKEERLNHLSKDSCVREIQVCDIRINELLSQINEVKEVLRTHKTFKKDEEILSKQNIPLYNAWLKLKYAEIEFNNANNGVKVTPASIRNEIVATKNTMQEVIDKFEL